MAEHGMENDPAAKASDLIAARAAQRRDAASDVKQDAVPEGGYPKTLAAFIRQNKGYILSTVGVIVIVAVLIVVAGSVMTGCSSQTPSETAEPGYESPYDWSALDRTDGRFQYVVDGQVKSRIGVDVSENQHVIDWDAVAADGIDFAMVRVGYRGATAGDLYLDERYWANIDGVRAAGLDCGVYFFSQAQTVDEAIEEADYVLEHLNGTPLEYPIAFDSEEVVLNLERSRTTGLSNDQMTAIARAFCDRVEEAGYDSMMYGNGIDMARYNYDEIGDYPIWWAEYGSTVPNHDLDIAMWQYANDGDVDGISTAVDLNIDLSGALS